MFSLITFLGNLRQHYDYNTLHLSTFPSLLFSFEFHSQKAHAAPFSPLGFPKVMHSWMSLCEMEIT